MSKQSCLLLTGVTGFIGSDIIARLLKNPKSPKLVVLARKKPNTKSSLLALRLKEYDLDPDYEINRIEWRETPFEEPLRFRNSLAALNVENTDWRVLHMAAIIKSSVENAAQDRLNMGVTQDILDWANKVGAPFFYLSSVVAFGVNSDSEVRDEDSLSSWDPFNEKLGYYRTKRLSHLYVKEHAKHGGIIFCPSVVHGALEHFKNSRGHLAAVQKGKLPFAPSGGANFVTLDHVASTIVENVLREELAPDISDCLLVGPNMPLVEYLNFYRETYREFLKENNSDGSKEKQIVKLNKSIPMLPKILGSASVGIAGTLHSMGMAGHTLMTLAQSSKYLFFKSKHLPDHSKDIDQLRTALIESMNAG